MKHTVSPGSTLEFTIEEFGNRVVFKQHIYGNKYETIVVDFDSLSIIAKILEFMHRGENLTYYFGEWLTAEEVQALEMEDEFKRLAHD